MRYLLDTQIFVWHITDSPKLQSDIKDIIESATNQIFISWASIWELTIKSSIGKLQPELNTKQLESYFLLHSFQIISFDFQHINELKKLAHHHRDPFDRMIIAQGTSEDLTIITSDTAFENYEAVILLNN